MTEQDKMREALRWSYEPPCAAQNDKAALVAMRGNKIELMLTGKKATVVNDLLQAALSTQQDNYARLLPVLEMAREALAYAWERYYMKADGSDALKQPFDLQVIIDALHAIHPIIPNAAINEVLGKE